MMVVLFFVYFAADRFLGVAHENHLIYMYIYIYSLFYCIHIHTYSMFSFVALKILYFLLSIGSINQRGNGDVLWDYLWLLIASFLQTSDGQRISGSYGSAVCGTRQDNRGHGKGRAEDGKPSQSRRRYVSTVF